MMWNKQDSKWLFFILTDCLIFFVSDRIHSFDNINVLGKFQRKIKNTEGRNANFQLLMAILLYIVNGFVSKSISVKLLMLIMEKPCLFHKNQTTKKTFM